MEMQDKSKKKKKMSYLIKSDGTVSGTELTVEGIKVTEKDKVVGIDFYSRGSIVYGPNPGEATRPQSRLSYTIISKDGEKEITQRVTIDPYSENGLSYEAIGAPSASDKASDLFIGKPSELIKDIESYRDKVKRFIPSLDELEVRSSDSLKDLLSDIKKEVSGER